MVQLSLGGRNSKVRRNKNFCTYETSDFLVPFYEVTFPEYSVLFKKRVLKKTSYVLSAQIAEFKDFSHKIINYQKENI